MASGICRAIVLDTADDNSESECYRYLNAGADFVNHGKHRRYIKCIGWLGIFIAALFVSFGFASYRSDVYMLVSCFLAASISVSFLSPDFLLLFFKCIGHIHRITLCTEDTSQKD